jgi:adenylate cyclase
MPSLETGLFRELKRRNVFRVAAMYAVAAWLVIQIADATFEPLGVSDSAHRILILVVALGFPVALVLGWVFDWTAEGLVRTPDDPEQEVVRLRSSRRIDFAIIAVLALALGMSLFGPKMEFANDQADARASIRSIAVLPLENLTGDPTQAYFVEGMTEALIMGLARISSLHVTSRTTMLQ